MAASGTRFCLLTTTRTSRCARSIKFGIFRSACFSRLDSTFQKSHALTALKMQVSGKNQRPKLTGGALNGTFIKSTIDQFQTRSTYDDFTLGTHNFAGEPLPNTPR